jgi:hypothetical protein
MTTFPFLAMRPPFRRYVREISSKTNRVLEPVQLYTKGPFFSTVWEAGKLPLEVYVNKKSWAAYSAVLSRYRDFVNGLSADTPGLLKHIQKLVDERDGPSYTVETPVVFNGALEEISAASEIKMILVADNPGRREQAAENRRYLVGPSGKIAEKFFRDHPELGIDFRKNVIILNKTPIHTPRTAELRELCRLGGKPAADAVLSSQTVMAELLLAFHEALSGQTPAGGSRPAAPGIPVWIIGYSEMKKGGIFETYTETLKSLYAAGAQPLRQRLFFYRHFSMNQFTIDLHKQAQAGEELARSLDRIGTAYRMRVLGW